MSCRDMDQLIQLYVDQEIREEDHERLRMHVAECSSCKQNLQDMIELVHALEEIGTSVQVKHTAIKRRVLRWSVLAATLIIITFFAPVDGPVREEASVPPNSPNGATANGIQESLGKDIEVMVFATQAEKLHIPKRDSIQVVPPLSLLEGVKTDTALVYPSAFQDLLQSDYSWQQKIRRVVFVKIPDDQTFRTLLSATGLGSDQGIGDIAFPISVMITWDKEPKLKTFTFPENEQEISNWFDRVTSDQPL